jgi:hypothetical protein
MKIMMMKSMRFLGLTSIDGVSGKGLADVTWKFLEKKELELKHCRGKDYDSAANMKGKNIAYKIEF